MELSARRFYRGLARLSRVDKIRVGLIILGLTTEQAADKIKRSAAGVRVALSQEEREGTLDRLEKMLDDELP
jgi:hypothetical protein